MILQIKFSKSGKKSGPIKISLFYALVMLSLIDVSQVRAETMINKDFELHINQTNDPLPTIPETEMKPSITPIITQSKITTKGSLTFSSSSNILDFGIMTPTNPTTRTIDMKVTGSTTGIAILFQADHDLTSEKGSIIPSTTCDNGSCTQETPSIWESTLTYGYGIRCNNKAGSLCNDDFIEKNAFASLKNQANQTASSIANGIIRYQNKQISLEHKVNISGTQTPGVYKNTLTYLIQPFF